MAKVLVSIEDRLLKRIDRTASSRGVSRSAYLAELARDDQARASGQGTAPEVRAALAELDALFASAPVGDATADIRAERDAR